MVEENKKSPSLNRDGPVVQELNQSKTRGTTLIPQLAEAGIYQARTRRNTHRGRNSYPYDSTALSSSDYHRTALLTMGEFVRAY